jgi:hypothetical protein
MIEEVGNSLLRNIDKNSNNSKDKERELHNDFISTASGIFNIDTLREQLISLFNEIGVPDFLFNDDNWQTFVVALLEEISDKEISYPEDIGENYEPESKYDRKAKDSYMRLLESAREKQPDNYRMYIATSVFISKNDEGKFTWNIQTIPQLKFTGMFVLRRNSN